MHKIYIDFKTTAFPIFIAGQPKYVNYPFAASIGILEGNSYKPSTVIFNIKNEDYKDVAVSLLDHIKKELGQHSIKYSDLQFFSWNPFTEQLIFNKMNVEIEVQNLSNEIFGSVAPETTIEKVSLDFDEEKHFEYTYETISNSRYFMVEMKKDAKKNFHKDGDLKTISIASLLGQLLYCELNKDILWKYNLNSDVDFAKFRFELDKYCKDNISRLNWIIANKELIVDRLKKVNELNEAYKALRAENDVLNSIKPSQEILSSLNTVKDYLEMLEAKVIELRNNIKATFALEISEEDKLRSQNNIEAKIAKVQSKINFLKTKDESQTIHAFIFDVDKQILILKNSRNDIQNQKDYKLHILVPQK